MGIVGLLHFGLFHVIELLNKETWSDWLVPRHGKTPRFLCATSVKLLIRVSRVRTPGGALKSTDFAEWTAGLVLSFCSQFTKPLVFAEKSGLYETRFHEKQLSDLLCANIYLWSSHPHAPLKS